MAKYCRVLHDKQQIWGEIKGDAVNLIEGNLFGEHSLSSRRIDLVEATLLAPVTPSKIICVGLNYQGHVKESKTADEAPKEPLLFFKPPSAIINPGDTIIGPAESERVDYEGEIGIVIGSRCHKVVVDEALDFIFGYTCANDVTARDLQRKDKQWARAKGFDTFCPVGPYIVTNLDPCKIRVQSRLNGEVRQSDSSENMIFSIPQLVSYISGIFTLLPGDLILTGTPEGVGPMSDGDRIEIEVEGAGVLLNSFERA